jgi:hypothetical protein
VDPLQYIAYLERKLMTKREDDENNVHFTTPSYPKPQRTSEKETNTPKEVNIPI